jgi:sigma-B regulation protein RsbU (phosphoserine phosphatase)
MMMAFRALLRTHAEGPSRPSQIMQAINRLLPQFTGVGDFVTSVYGVLDLKDGRFTYANSGHNPPMLLRADGRLEELNPGGPVLGVMQDATYCDEEITLAGRDLLVLYTDGVVEVARGREEQFGVRGLASTIRRSSDLPAVATISRVIQATRDFSGSESYQDDFTLVLIKREDNSSHA